jgi:hypothetical protein
MNPFWTFGRTPSQDLYLQHHTRTRVSTQGLSGIRTHDPTFRLVEAISFLDRAGTGIGLHNFSLGLANVLVLFLTENHAMKAYWGVQV